MLIVLSIQTLVLNHPPLKWAAISKGNPSFTIWEEHSRVQAQGSSLYCPITIWRVSMVIQICWYVFPNVIAELSWKFHQNPLIICRVMADFRLDSKHGDPDHHQNLITYNPGPLHKISSQSVTFGVMLPSMMTSIVILTESLITHIEPIARKLQKEDC